MKQLLLVLLPLAVLAQAPPAPSGAVAQDVINVRNAPFAAKGDGVRDDSAALSSALSACAPGGAVYLPPTSSFYSVTTLKLPDNCSLYGAPGSATAVRTSAAGSACSVFANPGPLTNASLSNLTIDGNGHCAGITVGQSNPASGLHLWNTTIRNTGPALAIRCGQASASCQNVSADHVNFSSTGGVSMATTGGYIYFNDVHWTNTSPNDAFHVYNNCGAGNAPPCEGGNISLLNSTSVGMDRIFAEVQGLVNTLLISGNSASGWTCTTDVACDAISVVDGLGGTVENNRFTYGRGSGGQLTPTLTNGVVTACSVNAGGNYTAGVPPIVYAQTRGAYTALPTFALTLTGTAITRCTVTSGGSGMLSAPPILIVIPATPPGVVQTPMIEAGNSGLKVLGNEIFGGGKGLVQDEAGENMTVNFNTFFGQNYLGLNCVGCRGTEYTGNKILEPGVAGIGASNLGADLTGFKISRNVIMRGNHVGDSGTKTFIGILLGGGSKGECSADDNSVIQTSLDPVPIFTGIELDVTNSGCTISRTRVKSLSTAPYGHLFDNKSGRGLDDTVLSENMGVNLAGTLTGAAPGRSTALVNNLCRGCASASPIDSAPLPASPGRQ